MRDRTKTSIFKPAYKRPLEPREDKTMKVVNKPIALALASLAVASLLWNVYSRVSSSGGGSRCRFFLSGTHGNYRLLKEELNRLESDVTRLKKHKILMGLDKAFAKEKLDKMEADHKELPAKVARLEKENKDLKKIIKEIPRKLYGLKGSSENYRKAAESLYNETDELKEKLKTLRSRLDNILKSIKSS